MTIEEETLSKKNKQSDEVFGAFASIEDAADAATVEASEVEVDVEAEAAAMTEGVEVEGAEKATAPRYFTYAGPHPTTAIAEISFTRGQATLIEDAALAADLVARKKLRASTGEEIAALSAPSSEKAGSDDTSQAE